MRIGGVSPFTGNQVGQLNDAGDAGEDGLIYALFSIGLNRPVSSELRACLDTLRVSDAFARLRWIAVDIQSGVCADSRRMLGREVDHRDDLCVTFHRLKYGHVVGPQRANRLRCVDIGLEGREHPTFDNSVKLVTVCNPAINKAQSASHHKFGYGHALVCAGSVANGGGARLAAHAALRSGAGLVTVGCPPDALSAVFKKCWV